MRIQIIKNEHENTLLTWLNRKKLLEKNVVVVLRIVSYLPFYLMNRNYSLRAVKIVEKLLL